MSNLPPGVNVNDIPGNRPEDIEYERKCDELTRLWMRDKALKVSPLNDVFDEEWFMLAVDMAMEFAFNEGWQARAQEHFLQLGDFDDND